MIRKQIYIEPKQDRALKAEAKRLGVSEAEVIRRRLDGGEERVDGPKDPEAWGRLRKAIEERMKLDVPQRPRFWTRDELYEDRLARFSRR
jgi:hypothetical protein